MLTGWDSPAECEAELKMYLCEYDEKWPTPKLQRIFESALNKYSAGSDWVEQEAR